MTIDLEALARKHAQLQGNSGENQDFKDKFFQLQPGDNVVRILPSSDENKQFYAETKLHRVTTT